MSGRPFGPPQAEGWSFREKFDFETTVQKQIGACFEVLNARDNAAITAHIDTLTIAVTFRLTDAILADQMDALNAELAAYNLREDAALRLRMSGAMNPSVIKPKPKDPPIWFNQRRLQILLNLYERRELLYKQFKTEKV